MHCTGNMDVRSSYPASIVRPQAIPTMAEPEKDDDLDLVVLTASCNQMNEQEWKADCNAWSATMDSIMRKRRKQSLNSIHLTSFSLLKDRFFSE